MNYYKAKGTYSRIGLRSMISTAPSATPLVIDPLQHVLTSPALPPQALLNFIEALPEELKSTVPYSKHKSIFDLIIDQQNSMSPVSMCLDTLARVSSGGSRGVEGLKAAIPWSRTLHAGETYSRIGLLRA